MLQIELNNIGKKFNKNWIFKSVSISLKTNDCLIVTGNNGSGKSTLLQIISGFVQATEGELVYKINEQIISSESLYKHLTIASPLLELEEELSLREQYEMFVVFKPSLFEISFKEFKNKIQLPNTGDKKIKFYSSGMKQRVKLGLAILSNSPFLFLDEPTSNLDANGISWYQEILKEYKENRIIIIASNEKEEDYPISNKYYKVEAS